MHGHSHRDERSAVDHDASDRAHTHEEHGARGHQHGVVDPSISTSERGIWALKWSFVVLFLTAIFQAVIVWLSGSVALLADTIHNFGDAATAIPLWVAFALSRRKANRRFTYGYGRVEDLAGVAIVVTIAFSALIAGYEAIQRLFDPQPIGHLWAVVAAAIIGFLGNEVVAILRVKVGREIHSAALVADGYHARVDGWTSLTVLVGAVGVWLGYPVTDPIVGLLIAVAIARIVWQSSKAVFGRMLEAVDPELVNEIHRTASDTAGVEKVTEVRARWLGHRLTAELNVAVASRLSVADGHAIAKNVRHELLHRLNYLSAVVIHVDPAEEAGEEFHEISKHEHDGLPVHSH